MKTKFITMSAMMIAFAASNCATDSPEGEQQTIKQRVAAAKIIPGEVAFENDRQAIYIDIPTKGGYVVIDVNTHAEKDLVTDEVYLRFKNEFDGRLDKNIDGRIPDNPDARSMAGSMCGSWQSISLEDPNSRVYRWCCNLSNGVCYRETCSCGYCC
jgi:hypothetical protein